MDPRLQLSIARGAGGEPGSSQQQHLAAAAAAAAATWKREDWNDRLGIPGSGGHRWLTTDQEKRLLVLVLLSRVFLSFHYFHY